MFEHQAMSQSSVEIEVKIICPENLLETRQPAHAVVTHPRHFEDNWLLDFEDARLRRAGSTVRVRAVNDVGTLTFKGPTQPHPQLKVREEMEVRTSDPITTLSILRRLGLRPIFRYQKFRTIYQVKTPSGLDLSAMYDETPIGNFLELEGSEAAIRETIQALHIPPENLTKLSYAALYQQKRSIEPGLPEDMIFPEHAMPTGGSR
jgi:adenylate cyclase class 2